MFSPSLFIRNANSSGKRLILNAIFYRLFLNLAFTKDVCAFTDELLELSEVK